MKLTEYGKDQPDVQFGIWIQSGYDDERENQLAIYFGRRCWWFKLDKAIVKPTEKWVDASHYDWAKPVLSQPMHSIWEVKEFLQARVIVLLIRQCILKLRVIAKTATLPLLQQNGTQSGLS